ncbi:uncharacterized protein LOC130993894 [Salvia miltiorrhiza]|uniref:uncharacterized protein LOC130993894 n=1 Tax=Salvia miltiorrhiza TaxID=226208 RepID=UPI0025AD78DD|nr:uncharacterized protein LOC130993894 [Salvia miltiorrhiza]
MDKIAVWGSEKGEIAVRNAEGRLGGILTMWNPEKFSVSSQWEAPGLVFVNGLWNSNSSIFCCCSINVYAQQSLPERLILWDIISSVVEQNVDSWICIGRDFKLIRDTPERARRSFNFHSRDIMAFDGFIKDNELIDIRLQGMRFTWYQPQGNCKSKLDRFVVNEKWLQSWPHTKVVGLPRTVSDHCPLLLETKYVDWGPKPFCFINSWTSHPDFEKVMRDSWNKSGIQG